MAGVRRRKKKDGTPRPHYEGWYMDYQGKQRFFRGTSSRKETLAMAKETENRHRLIRLGHLPSPEESQKPRPFVEVRDEYMAWGRSEGGLRGHPWAPAYARGMERRLKFWARELKPADIRDLDGCLPRVERALRRLKKDGLSALASGLPASAPLFHVPGHTARNVRRDLKAAGVAITTSDGYVDFHALRTTYITLVTEAGANTKEAQVLARHSASDLTHRVYVRVRDDRLHALAEAVGRVVDPLENYDPGMARPPVGHHGDRPNPKSDEALDADRAPHGRHSSAVSPIHGAGGHGHAGAEAASAADCRTWTWLRPWLSGDAQQNCAWSWVAQQNCATRTRLERNAFAL